MHVTVQLFARLREVAKGQDWTYDVPPGSTVGDVWRIVMATHPGLEHFATAVSAAVNEDFAAMTADVHDGDTVAFLPPVSGGAERETCQA